MLDIYFCFLQWKYFGFLCKYFFISKSLSLFCYIYELQSIKYNFCNHCVPASHLLWHSWWYFCMGFSCILVILSCFVLFFSPAYLRMASGRFTEGLRHGVTVDVLFSATPWTIYFSSLPLDCYKLKTLLWSLPHIKKKMRVVFKKLLAPVIGLCTRLDPLFLNKKKSKSWLRFLLKCARAPPPSIQAELQSRTPVLHRNCPMEGGMASFPQTPVTFGTLEESEMNSASFKKLSYSDLHNSIFL